MPKERKQEMSLAKLHKEYEEAFVKRWGEYLQLHRDLDAYRGMVIDASNVQIINSIIVKLQDCFIDLYPTLNFVVSRAALCNTAIMEYNKFMDDIKLGGAEPEGVLYESSKEPPRLIH